MAGNNVWSWRYSSLSACLVCVKPWVQSLAPFKPFVVAHACKPSTREVEAEGSEIQAFSSTYKFKIRLGYMRLSFFSFPKI